ncbi:MAG: carboxypeptidase regulatory-like domain-containing protein, partial [Lutibacter sp.]
MKSIKLFIGLGFYLATLFYLSTNNNSINQEYNDCQTTISGKILDNDTKTPIEGATISLLKDGSIIKTLTVNNSGSFSFKLSCNSPYSISVKNKSYHSQTFNFTSSKNTPIFKNFLLKKACFQIISGTIINEFSNKIVDNATLTLYLKGEEIATTQVGPSGKYSFKVNCNSNYYIVANKLNFVNDLYEFSTGSDSGKNIKHDFILEPECIQTITGIIKNKVTLEPVSAKLSLYLNNVKIETINVNNDGSYLIKFQCTTNYKIVAEKEGFKEDSYNFLTDYIENKQPDYFHLEKDLFLEPNECYQIVLGKVLQKENKQPIDNATVSLFYQNQEINTYQTNYDGSFKFNIKCDNKYELQATKAGMRGNPVTFTANKNKGDDKTINLYLEDETCDQTISGVILDEKTKQPIINASVQLLENNMPVDKKMSDSSGKFNFHAICNTKYELIIKNEKYNNKRLSFSTSKIRNENLSKNILLKPIPCKQLITGVV